ncbi:hypothetical protein LS482_03060 [Sinomicrobium kalidii]|uniref:hypothetical protein n=1 Tax=Sinomicrobium kalidii TaxID=2900738 RepID=UPI001E606F81|nr:hypothetical protein [Sinomicrobium kalidii]UGU16858.1 hypothetical protein LS482_03060 [Sinomicrobium kalidii]
MKNVKRFSPLIIIWGLILLSSCDTDDFMENLPEESTEIHNVFADTGNEHNKPDEKDDD